MYTEAATPICSVASIVIKKPRQVFHLIISTVHHPQTYNTDYKKQPIVIFAYKEAYMY